MASRLVYHHKVAEDIAAADAYYDKISTQLAERFKFAMVSRLNRIASHPTSFPIDVAPIRFARIDHFPYLIFFRVADEHILVLAVLHGSRDPLNWRLR